jgi:2-amino-4-hydroxy-6-hydroxymethyldihydropteridine diphosphokinase
MKLKGELNWFQKFSDWYWKIISDFGFEHQKDVEARDILIKYFQQKEKWNLEEKIREIKQLVQSKPNILIYGCGPTLEETLLNLEKDENLSILKSFLNITADGASLFLSQKKIPIDVIFSDLDGITRAEFDYSEFLIVHGHGDNINQLKEFKEEIKKKKNIIGTTQVNPKGDIINPGGFTDGDRILFFLRTLLSEDQTLYFIGMDFKETVGRFSKPYLKENRAANEMKTKKLHYAVKLIEWIKREIPNDMIFVNSPRFSDKFSFISVERFLERVS